jgi:hypothetical protein
MPLHDWNTLSGLDGVHHSWITELLRWVKPRLPAGYRAYVGAVPTVAVGAPEGRPGVHVRQWNEAETPQLAAPLPGSAGLDEEPDVEIATATVDPSKAIYVERGGCLVAALELVSPRKKDRAAARATYASRYGGYLLQGVHLVLVDVHRRPINFSFADRIAEELQIPNQPSLQPPLAIAYRVGEPAATGGSLIGIWRRPLTVGEALPSMRLPLSVGQSVLVDLEQTYSRAAADAYLT